ncbi:MAG: hypothetical protein Q9M91_05175 [Candidatus Dojkabacteria bacterium]|nr:hypothetical protein [Candidatus Dojkabacteria bacterium]MDQ7021197.1 hypothetical protein [Candidatus Dojkabacteria bacterium]
MKGFVLPPLMTSKQMMVGGTDAFNELFGNEYEFIPLNYEVDNSDFRPSQIINKFAADVQAKIENELEDDEDYFIVPISMGYSVLNLLRDLKRDPKFIMAISPFLGKESINVPKERLNKITGALKLITSLKMEKAFWRPSVVKHFSGDREDYLQHVIDIFHPSIAISSFFNCISIKNEEFTRKEIPHLVIMNKEDNIINYNFVERWIKENVEDHHIINTNMPHSPKKLEKEYFYEGFSTISDDIYEWFKKQND